MRPIIRLGLLAALFSATACTTASSDGNSNPSSTALPAPAPTSTPTSAPSPSSSAVDDQPEEGSVVGTVVRFASGETMVDVTIAEDTPATRDFLSMLPLTLSFEKFAGREKISYLPRELETDGSPGSDPEDGDLIYFVPWGNLGFYYNAAGIGYSDDVLRIGTYAASIEQLESLEGGDVTVEIGS